MCISKALSTCLGEIPDLPQVVTDSLLHPNSSSVDEWNKDLLWLPHRSAGLKPWFLIFSPSLLLLLMQLRLGGGAVKGWTTPSTVLMPSQRSPPWLCRISSTRPTGSPLTSSLSYSDRCSKDVLSLPCNVFTEMYQLKSIFLLQQNLINYHLLLHSI